MRNILLVISAAATFFVFTGFSQNTEKDIFKCPYVQKLHQANQQSKCPYLNKKQDVRESKKENEAKCPFSGKSKEKEQRISNSEKKLKFT